MVTPARPMKQIGKSAVRAGVNGAAPAKASQFGANLGKILRSSLSSVIPGGLRSQNPQQYNKSRNGGLQFGPKVDYFNTKNNKRQYA